MGDGPRPGVRRAPILISAGPDPRPPPAMTADPVRPTREASVPRSPTPTRAARASAISARPFNLGEARSPHPSLRDQPLGDPDIPLRPGSTRSPRREPHHPGLGVAPASLPIDPAVAERLLQRCRMGETGALRSLASKDEPNSARRRVVRFKPGTPGHGVSDQQLRSFRCHRTPNRITRARWRSACALARLVLAARGHGFRGRRHLARGPNSTAMERGERHLWQRSDGHRHHRGDQRRGEGSVGSASEDGARQAL